MAFGEQVLTQSGIHADIFQNFNLIFQRVPYIIQCVETYDREAFLAGKGATFHVQRTMVRDPPSLFRRELNQPLTLSQVNPTISELVAQAKADFGDGRQVPVQPKPNNGFPVGACAGCGSAKGKDGGNLQQCGRCKSRKYCGKKCQKKDWPKHKVGCKQA